MQDMRLGDSIAIIKDYVRGLNLLDFRAPELERLANDGHDQSRSYGKHRMSYTFQAFGRPPAKED